MYKKDVIAKVGTITGVARLLGIARASVYDWHNDRPIPELRARQLADRVEGLTFDPKLYETSENAQVRE